MYTLQKLHVNTHKQTHTLKQMQANMYVFLRVEYVCVDSEKNKFASACFFFSCHHFFLHLCCPISTLDKCAHTRRRVRPFFFFFFSFCVDLSKSICKHSLMHTFDYLFFFKDCLHLCCFFSMHKQLPSFSLILFLQFSCSQTP